MMPEHPHLSDQDLLLWADGELSSQRGAEIQQHLSNCWACRTRMAELEHAIADFVHLYQDECDAKLPPIDGPRALLKARLAESTGASGVGSNRWFTRVRPVRVASVLAALLLLTAIGIRISQHRKVRGNSGQAAYLLSKIGAIPNASLTPGATYPISTQDVCSAQSSTNDPAVPDPLRREVWQEYGLNDVSNNYEIDYLVTPRLGGATNIRNLWPEPSQNTRWNSRVKDALEDRLHQLVCGGQLDLATAQREISQNWVAAYKKYFGTDDLVNSE